ncbi:MAG: DNA repair protein RecO [Bacteroidota bacterium]
MLHRTQGIVLSYIKYRETSVITNIFTEAWGLQGYLVHGVRAKKPKYGMALFQPLTLLDMVVYHKKQGGLQRVAEVKCHKPISNILGDLKKAAMAVFLAEFLAKVVREEERNESLFNFLWQSVLALDEQATHYELFYLRFLLQLCHYLGFGVGAAEDIYAQLRRSGQHGALTQEAMEGINGLLQGYVPMDRHLRRNVTEVVIKFYQLHIDSLDNLKSLKVLQEIS